MSKTEEKFNNFVRIVEKLRSEEGCPWDRDQTAGSLRRYLLEETQETLEAINDNDPHHIKEELGDLLYLIVLLSQIHHEKNLFNISEVIDEISQKMVRRHPHVFEDKTFGSAEELRDQWLEIKRNEKSAKDKT
ncbi:MAG: nucleotide pyrophosphohydrolase [Proteobacteria bacterium]|nr:nucleotide pyrophosphohydrolase [Pseudomonadota bacterium]